MYDFYNEEQTKEAAKQLGLPEHWDIIYVSMEAECIHRNYEEALQDHQYTKGYLSAQEAIDILEESVYTYDVPKGWVVVGMKGEGSLVKYGMVKLEGD